MVAGSKALRSASALVEAQLIKPERLAALKNVASRYAVAITPTIVDLIDTADPHDPIALQFVPDERELETHPEENADPIGDEAHSPVPGVVHRYPDRVLLKVVNACAVYCRFCFRREMIGPGRGALTGRALTAAIDYIARTPEIWEVILTGGDPLLLPPRRLKDVVTRLAVIDHVKVIRVHTRIPVAAPERVTPALLRALQTDKAMFIVLHANHPRELSSEA